MYVCVCNAVTDSDIRKAVDGGIRNFRQLKLVTGCSAGCGCCEDMALEILQRALSEKRPEKNLLPVMQLV